MSEHEFSLPHILLLLLLLLLLLRMPWQLSMAEFQAQVSALQQRIDGAALRDKKAAAAAAAAH